MGGSNAKPSQFQLPSQTVMTDEKGNLVALPVAQANAEKQAAQQQHQQLEDSLNSARSQFQGQQNAAFEMNYAKQNSGFSLPKTNLNLTSPNPYGRDFSKTAEPEAPKD